MPALFFLHFVIVLAVVVPGSWLAERLFLAGSSRDPFGRHVRAILGTCCFGIVIVGLGMPWLTDLPAAFGFAGVAVALWRLGTARRERAATGYRPAKAPERYMVEERDDVVDNVAEDDEEEDEPPGEQRQLIDRF